MSDSGLNSKAPQEELNGSLPTNDGGTRETLGRIFNASTPAQLEAAFQWWLNLQPWGNKRPDEGRVKEAVLLRGIQLVGESKFASRIPAIRQRGRQFIVTCAGKEYKTGRWGNGAGYRWVLADVYDWVGKTGGYRSKDRAIAVVDWVLYGMPHRAMRRLM